MAQAAAAAIPALERIDMSVDAKTVKTLRDETGAGMMDCKRALEETNGDLEAARKVLREKGLADAKKRSGRTAAEGVVGSYLHPQLGRDVVGVLVEINCETDFVAKSDDFKNLAHDIAMHIAAAKPEWLDRDEVPGDVVKAEEEVAEGKAKAEGKPEKILPKIVEGRMNSFFKERCLIEQPFVRDDKQTIGALVDSLSAKVGEKIEVRRFVRYAVGDEA